MSALAFGGAIAAIAVGFGTRDLESYEHSFFSLDRGTAMQAVEVLGHPVYTLAIGFGTRLPLSASLGASPIAAVAPYLPAPLTYWALIAFSIAAAVMVARHALEPICGRIVSWLAMVLLFCSVPIVNYTVSDDWPEGAVNYCVFVGCVFAPHALLALRNAAHVSTAARRLACLSLAGAVWSLVALSHPGLWPLLGGALVLTAALALFRSDHPLRARLTVAAVLAVVSFVAVALQLPDFIRELDIARESGLIGRVAGVATGDLMPANVFPFGEVFPRSPFTFLLLALLSFTIGLASNDVHSRRLTVGSALISIGLSIAAVTVSPGSAVYAPSTIWMLRDPAIAFAILSAASAAGSMRRSGGVRHFARVGPVVAALAIAGLQGPSLAGHLALANDSANGWNQDMTTREERVAVRGLPRDRVLPGERLALWPGVRRAMRRERMASTDFADAGYLLTTAWTKQRTMRGLVEPNNVLFDQTTDLSAQVLCDPVAVRFLRLRYLVTPPQVTCAPWAQLSDLQVDDRFDLGVATERVDMAWAVPVANLSDRVGREPALSAGSALLRVLAPLSETSLSIAGTSVLIRLADLSVAANQVLVLPVAFDSGWHASSGKVHNVGGLVALVDVDQRQVSVDYVPDAVAVMRAASMTLAQILAVAGFLGLACVRPARPTPGHRSRPPTDERGR
jgi:hypothetical protein